MKILILERDIALGQFLQKMLQAEGHSVSLLHDSAALFGEMEQVLPQLAVLDVQSLGRNGLDTLRSLKTMTRGVTLLALASSEVKHRVDCLEFGADDCLSKPFSFQELIARCRALLRRVVTCISNVLSHGPLTLDRVERSVAIRDRSVELTAREFSLLEQLMLANGRCCSREQLLSSVFQTVAGVSSNVVDVYITYLRKKLAAADEGNASAQLIETQRGFGYRLAGMGGYGGGSKWTRDFAVAAA